MWFSRWHHFSIALMIFLCACVGIPPNLLFSCETRRKNFQKSLFKAFKVRFNHPISLHFYPLVNVSEAEVLDASKCTLIFSLSSNFEIFPGKHRNLDQKCLKHALSQAVHWRRSWTRSRICLTRPLSTAPIREFRYVAVQLFTGCQMANA